MNKQNIILDLDHTLLYTPDDENWYSKIKGLEGEDVLRRRVFAYEIPDIKMKGSGYSDKYVTILRPHCRKFLTYCFNRFDSVCIWSAGRREYVLEIVKYLFSSHRYPDIVFTYDELVGGIKPIQHLIDMTKSDDSMSLKNTFIVDDLEDNFYENEDNGILIPQYHPKMTKSGLLSDDNALINLIKWFNKPEVIKAKDIREINKSKIFKK